MRIIGGTYQGKRLHAPSKLPVRPTTDFAREALFNILRHRVDWPELRVLDLFAGIGGISLECASRGAQVTAVEKHRGCVRFLRSVVSDWDVSNLHVVQEDVFRFVPRSVTTFDIVFADPPYDLDALTSLPELVLSSQVLPSGGTFILEHGTNHTFDQQDHFQEHRQYGAVNFSFFEKP